MSRFLPLWCALTLLAACAETTGGSKPPGTTTDSGGTETDADRDGFGVAAGDCDDALPAVNPAATDIVGDDIDQNCDGVDGTDSDRDGSPSLASGGADCDDHAASVYPGAADIVGDGIDQGCDGVDGADADVDGVPSEASGGADCDDASAASYPGAVDSVGDGVDQSCDGVDGVDADGDGFAAEESGGDDCLDADPSVHPAAADAVGDALDSDCDGVDGVDHDGDAQASIASGGVDCDDDAPTVGAGFADAVGDGIDQSCDGIDGADGDGDGWASLASGGADCDDALAAVNPAATDPAGDGVDGDCDGADGVDLDGDGFASVASGGADCDDADPLLEAADLDLDGDSTCDGDCDDLDAGRFPANPEECDLVDDDCDGVPDFAGAVDACARLLVEEVRAGALDVLFVIDDSASMGAKQARAIDAVDELLTPLVGVTDLHVGVVTTDMDAPAKRGHLQPGPDGALYLDASYDLVDAVPWLEAALDQGTFGSGVEQPLQTSYTALDFLGATFNAGFSRPEADLAIVFVTDEGDSSAILPADWEAWFSGYVAAPAVGTVHAVAGPLMSCGADWVSAGTAVLDLAATFGGVQVSICDPDWGADFAAIADQILPPAGFDGVIALADLPDVATLIVTVTEPAGAVVALVDGVDYVYDAVANEVVFTGYAPVVGATVTIAYRAVP